MGKKKKKFQKRINPEKSNKMIYAVVAGLALLIAVFLYFTISYDTVENKEELMNDTLKYLKNAEGIIKIDIHHQANNVIIVYEKHIKETKKKDFDKITRYAGIKLSNKMGDEQITILLCEDTPENKVRFFTFKGGRSIEEKELR